ncbi:trafficking protein particle complex subunit 12 [Orussus abietinus]|uniref:trafficking protein particle complex subunit 12 n=1 Tax=Orussus abietinus TaxID=222816 RepID=UPI0006263D41|nr:trafficking protein particle complex subunit 12 [Orussus abietinus]
MNMINASNQTDCNKADNVDSGKPSAHIGRYFSNTGHTIFDEIAPSVKTDASNYDIHKDAWIPPDHSRKVLSSIATSMPGNNYLVRDNLTMPGVLIQEDMPDIIKETANKVLGEAEARHRNVLSAADVTQDERGLRHLIQVGCYRAAINLSGKLLAVYGQGFGKIDNPSKHTPHSLQLWYTRLALLAKIKNIEILKQEAEPFGSLNKPDMFFRFYPELYGTRSGSMASFAFRLLLAEIPAICGKPKLAIDNLYSILAVINEIIENLKAGLTEDGTHIKYSSQERDGAITLWLGRKSRTLISIVNCAVNVKNYTLAVSIMHYILKTVEWSTAQRDILESALSRIYLLSGDISAAERILDNKSDAQNADFKHLIDRGLVAISQGAFQKSIEYMQLIPDLDTSITAANNMAVCMLYKGQLREAVQFLENAIARNPAKNLQEPVILNICTLYELHTTYSKQPKQLVLRQLNRCKGDISDIQCLKLL